MGQAEINHAYEGHGPGKEKEADQLPITPADIARIPEIIDHPDKSTFSTSEGKVDCLVHEKRVNGTIYVVEEIRRRRRHLAFKSMRKKQA